LFDIDVKLGLSQQRWNALLWEQRIEKVWMWAGMRGGWIKLSNADVRDIRASAK